MLSFGLRRAAIAYLLGLLWLSAGCGSSPTAPAPLLDLGAGASPAPFIESVSLTASPSLVTPGDQLTIAWLAPSGRGCVGGGDWIALYKVGDPDKTGAANGHSDVWYDHVCGAVTGKFTLTAPSQPADYEFRYMVGDTSVARSNPVTVDAH
jgi:hypothetical protein